MCKSGRSFGKCGPNGSGSAMKIGKAGKQQVVVHSENALFDNEAGLSCRSRLRALLRLPHCAPQQRQRFKVEHARRSMTPCIQTKPTSVTIEACAIGSAWLVSVGRRLKDGPHCMQTASSAQVRSWLPDQDLKCSQTLPN